MKLQELVGETKTDAMAGAASSSSVTSHSLHHPMVPRSPATPRAPLIPVPQAHELSRLGGARSSSLELSLMMDGVAPSPIDLNHTPAPMESAQASDMKKMSPLLH
jgi:hypothetical protein